MQLTAFFDMGASDVKSNRGRKINRVAPQPQRGRVGTVFGDPVVATAILDRLLHQSHVITIRGDSYRLKEKRRSGILQNATVGEGKVEKNAQCGGWCRSG
jgi:IstB-like ATP binding protein